MCVHPWFNQSFWAVFNMNGGRDVSFGLSWVVNAITNIWHLVGAHHCPSLRNHCYSVLEILAGFSAAETSGSIFWMTSQIPPLIYSRYMSFMSVANSDFRPPDFGPFLLQLRWKISTKLPRCQASFWSPGQVPPKYDISGISEISQLQPVHIWRFRYFRHCFKMMYPTKLEVMCGFCSWFRSTQWIVKIHEIGYWSLIICNLKTHK